MNIETLSLEDEDSKNGKLKLELSGLVTYSVDFGDRLVTYYSSASIGSHEYDDYESELVAINRALPKNKQVDYLIDIYFDGQGDKREFDNVVLDKLTIGFQNKFFEDLKNTVIDKLSEAITEVASLTGAQHLLDREIKFCFVTDYNQMYSSLKFKFA